MLLLSYLVLFLELYPIVAASPETLTITIPDVYPNVDTHLCVMKSIPNNTDYYIGESFDQTFCKTYVLLQSDSSRSFSVQNTTIIEHYSHVVRPQDMTSGIVTTVSYRTTKTFHPVLCVS